MLPRLRRRLAPLIALIALLPAACIHVGIGNDAGDLVTRRHAIESRPLNPETVPEADAPPAPTLSVRPFESGRRYTLRIVARDSTGGIEFLDNERWAEEPRDALTVVAREGLASCGPFQACIPATVNLSAGLTLDGDVLACDLVREATGPSRARIRLRLLLGDYGTGEVLHSGVFEATEALPGAGAEGIGPAMSAATADALRQALDAWTAAGVLGPR
jgi:ABC-type uncharacterized transport system auxiliary subunit